MKNETIDRVEVDILSWRDQDNKYKAMFPDYMGNEKYIMEEKLKHMISVYKKYQNLPITKEEQKSLRVLKGKISDLENVLYPTIMERIAARINRWFERVRDNYYEAQQHHKIMVVKTVQKKQSFSNTQQLKKSTRQKLHRALDVIFPDFLQAHKSQQAQANKNSVQQKATKQVRALESSLHKMERPRHRHRLQ